MHNVSVSMPESPSQWKGRIFDEGYKKRQKDLKECDAVLVRSAKMHDMELPGEALR